jgi:hypothetical protein
MSNEQEDLSRRLMLRGSALAGLSAVVQACSSNPPVTPVDGGRDVGTDTVTQPDGGSSTADIAVLNALLAAEYNAIKAYDAGAGILMAPPAMDPRAGVAPLLLQVAMRFQTQHRDHAAQLVAAITAAGGTPVAEASVMFTAPTGFTPSVVNVLKLACNAEKAASIAYNGAVGGMSDAGRRFLAATIEGDETQHYIVLYMLLKQAVSAGPGLLTMLSAVVPASFVSNVGTTPNGLETVADFTYA